MNPVPLSYTGGQRCAWKLMHPPCSGGPFALTISLGEWNHYMERR